MNAKRILVIFLLICLSLSVGCGKSAPAETPAPGTEEPAEAPALSIPQDDLGYTPGKTMPDFSFTDCRGENHSLYGTLAEKKLVLINIWATWCGPCGMEFPYMEEAYQQYKDEVEIFAFSCEPSDSNEVLAAYGEEKGLSFPLAQDSSNLAAAFMAYSIPTTVVVDRYGTVCAVETGAKTSTEAFTGLFDRYLGENYKGYVDPNAAPLCDVAPASPEALNEALNIPGGKLSFENVDSEHIWPLLPAEKDGRSVLVSSNQAIGGSSAALSVEVTAEAGDVLAVSFALSSEEALDLMKLSVNGSCVKSFGGEKNWMSYAYRFEEAGVYDITVSYEKNKLDDFGEDSLWLDSIALLSGDEAEAALASNPVYPKAELSSLRPIGEGVRELVLDDPYGAIINDSNRDILSFFVIGGDRARFRLELAEDVDPEALVFFSDYDGSVRSVLSCAAEGGYELSLGVDSLEATGYPYSMLYLEDASGVESFRKIVTYFEDEENLELFVKNYLTSQDGQDLVSWHYADMAPGDAEYCVRFVDLKGHSVEGVMLQVCDESLCQVFVSDSLGECRFSLPAYPYELHVLSVPEGYALPDGDYTASPEGGELEIIIEG